MFKIKSQSTNIGRPVKERGFNCDNIATKNDNYLKTVVVHVRVSDDEKEYLKNKSKSKSENISSYIRRLIFDIYLERLRNKNNLVEFINGRGLYPFIDERTSYIHIRFTEREKFEVEKLAQQYHRGISDFIRWVSIQLPIDEMITNI